MICFTFTIKKKQKNTWFIFVVLERNSKQLLKNICLLIKLSKFQDRQKKKKKKRGNKKNKIPEVIFKLDSIEVIFIWAKINLQKKEKRNSIFARRE